MKIEWLAVVDSTMEEARHRAESGAQHGSAVAARHQRQGRGRAARSWSSPVGNLHVTVVLRPDSPVARAPELGFVTSLAVAEAVDRLAGSATMLKWPNDILRHGAKLAGVLLERLDDGAVLAGIGLNVRHTPPDTPYPVTSLAAEGLDLTPDAVLDVILLRLDAVWAIWRQHGFERVLQLWSQRGPSPGAALQVRLPNETVAGSFAGLALDGSLLLDTQAGRRTLVAGEVLLQ